MNAHPLADLIPEMTDSEYAELKQSIAENGLREPIVLFEQQILDGRHRYRACRELGIDPEVDVYKGDQPANLVWDLNGHRRHLSPAQLAACAVAFLPELEAEARGRQAHGTTAPGKKRSAPVGAQRPDDDIPPEKQTSSADRATARAAAKTGASPRSVQRMKRVAEEDPELFEQVKKGERTMRSADLEIKARVEGREGPTVMEVTTERHRQLAAKAKQRMETAVGMAAGINSGFPHLRPDRALAVATQDEVDGWLSVFADARKTIRDLTRQLEDIR